MASSGPPKSSEKPATVLKLLRLCVLRFADPGVKLALRLLAEIGDDRNRFPTAQSLQCYAGAAPMAHMHNGYAQSAQKAVTIRDELKINIPSCDEIIRPAS